jgi:hypothetical protein
MSHPVSEMRNESVGQWLPLIEYSIKSGVSLSTIRRKIKSNSIPFKLEKGKYLILFNGEGHKWDGVHNLSSLETERPSSITQDASETIRKQKVRIEQLEEELAEMALLVRTLEQKYGVRY